MDLEGIPPAAIAAAAGEARAFLRIEGTGEAALLERLADTAIRVAEAFTGTLLIARAVEEIVPADTGWRVLGTMPVRSITGATVPGGAALAVGAYAVDITGDGVGWVRTIDAGGATRVAFAHVAGVAETWEALPAPLSQGVVALIAHLFDHRGGDARPPAAVAALWRPYRRLALDTRRRA